MPLGPRERVVLLQVDDVKVLIGVTPGEIETLYVQGQPITEARVAGVTGNFGEQLATAVKRVEMP
jgi:flagellar biogenesis protein FliO